MAKSGFPICFPFLIALLLNSCRNEQNEVPFFYDLGEIPFDRNIDDPEFELCSENLTRPFNYTGIGLVYKSEKRTLINQIKERFDLPASKGQHGFITIRFIINCEGNSGRFRMEQTYFDLEPMRFDSSISEKILSVVKSLDGWQAFEQRGKTWDYQQYLTFKLKDGQIIEILP